MSVEVNDGGLNWKARIDTSDFQRDAEKMAEIVNTAAKKSLTEQEKLLRQVGTANRSAVQDGLEALKAQTPEMQKQIAIIQTFQKELVQVKNAQKELEKDQKRGLITQREYNKASQGLSVRFAEINENIRKYTDGLKASRRVMDAANGSIDQKRAKLQQLVTQYSALSEAELRNSRIGGAMAREIRKLDGELSRATRSMKGFTDSNRVLNRVLAATAGLFTLAQANRFVRDLIRVRGEIQQLEVAFTTILKSKEKANDLFREVVQIANSTPFTVTEVADGAKQLLAYGFAAEEVREQILAIGNVAKGTGSTFQEVAYAYGTLKTQGRAFARDIRQFTTRGIPIVGELAKQFGVTEQRVNELVSAGKVGFPEVEKAFKSLTSEGGTFFNLMEEQSKTVTGQIAILQGKIQLMLNSIGESNDGIIKSGIGGLTSLVENYEKIAEMLGALIVLYGSYRAALILTSAAQGLVAAGVTGMTAAQAINAATTAVATRATALWGAAMNALPLVALTTLIASLIGVVYAWNTAVDSATASQNRLNDIQAEGEASAKKEKEKVEDLIAVLKSEVATISQKEGAMRGLQSILGDYIDGYTQEEIAAGKAEKAITDYTEALRKSVEIKEAFEAYQRLGDEILEVEKKGVEALKSYEQMGQNLKNVFSLNGRSLGQYFKELFFVDDEELINRNKKALQEQRDALKETFDFTNLLTGVDSKPITKEFDTLIKNVVDNYDRLIEVATNKADFDKIKQGLQDFLEELAPDDPQIEEIKRKIEKVNDLLKTYSISSQNKEIKDATKERKKILDQLNKLEQEAFIKGFDQREQEIQRVRAQYEELRKAAREAGLGQGVLDRIDRLEERATGDIIYRSETDQLKKELEKRKSLYRDLEVFQKDFGILAAEERYSTELDIAKSYLDLIQEEYDKLIVIDPEQRSGTQNERLSFLQKELDDEKKFQQKKYDEFLKTLEDYETKRAKITEQYILDRQKLIEKGDTGYLEQLKENYEMELGDLDDNNARKLGLYQQFFRGLETLSVAASRKLIADLRRNLEALRGAGKVTDAFYRDMLERLNRAELQTNLRIPQGLQTMAQEFANISREIGEANKGLTNMLNLLSNSLSRVADIKANIAQFDLAKKANGGQGDMLGMAVAGLGTFGAAIGIAQSLSNVIAQGMEKQAEILRKQYEFQRQIYFGELEISRLERQRAIENADADQATLKGLERRREEIEKALNSVKTNTKEIEDIFNRDIAQSQLDQLSLYDFQSKWNKKEAEKIMQELADSLFVAGTKTVKGGFLGLGKREVEVFQSLAGLSFKDIEDLSLKGQLTEQAEKLFQELKKLKEEGADLEKQLKEIDEAFKNIFTGGATASGIADTIIQGFRQGKRAVEDFGDDVEDILRNAILSGFKYRFLEAPLNDLLEQLYRDAVSGDELDASEIANFQDAFGNIIDQYRSVFDDLQEATGIDLSNVTGSERGLSGAIRRELTEATGSELAGLMRGQFDIAKRQLQIGVETLQYTAMIEKNTFNTVQELKELVKINQDIRKNTTSASDRDLGI